VSRPDATSEAGAPTTEHDPVTPAGSPLWPLVAALAGIAARIEQRLAEEHETEDEAAA
jgi:hypothetical protein